jgi:hypothetical protein
MHRDHALAIALAEYEPEVRGGAQSSAIHDGGESKGGYEPLMRMIQLNYKPPKAHASSALSIYQQLCSNIHLTGPTPDVVARDVQLEHIVRHPITLELFKDAMIKDVCVESLMLYLDIRRYKVTLPLRFNY